MSGYRRTATDAMLRARAVMLARIRTFFAERNVLEVQTPVLSRSGLTDLHLESMAVDTGTLGRCYLHTSPEYAMKRLLAAGIGDIYQICPVFRDDEIGRWHQPEFTMLEWYRVGWNERQLMDETETLLTQLIAGARRSADGPCAVRSTYAQAFRHAVGVSPDAPDARIVTALRERGCDVPAGLRGNDLLDLAFSTQVMPAMDRSRLTFIDDFPAQQAALARLKPGSPPVAARFEAFFAGLELANGFAELTDAGEQRARFAREAAERQRLGRALAPLDEDFLAALQQGLPECAGVAVGLDRLLAAAVGATELAATIAFAHTPRHRHTPDDP